MKQRIEILSAIVIATVLFGCSQSSKGGDNDTSSESIMDTTSDSQLHSSSDSGIDTAPASDSDTESIGDAKATESTDAETDSYTATESEIDTNTVPVTDTDSDTDFDSNSDVDTDNDKETNSDSNTDLNTDSNIDTGSDSVVDVDSSTEPIVTSCPSADNVVKCHNDDIWCFGSDDIPTELVSSCPDNLVCVELSEGGVQCQCEPNTSKGCYEGSIWNYDSCGRRANLAQACAENEHCVEWSENNVECNECEGYWGGDNCDECKGYNGGDTEHCQCPNDTFYPLAGTDICFSPAIECIGDDCGEYLNYMTWEQATRSCPYGFRLPVPDEIAEYLFDGAAESFDGEDYHHGICESYTCGEIDTLTGIIIWTTKECESGHYVYYIREPNLGSISCRDWEHDQVICISN